MFTKKMSNCSKFSVEIAGKKYFLWKISTHNKRNKIPFYEVKSNQRKTTQISPYKSNKNTAFGIIFDRIIIPELE